MIAKEIESLIKNTLSQYAQDYNAIHHEAEEGDTRKIDFNITYTKHVMDPSQVEGYDPSDPKFAAVKRYEGRTLAYLRVVKVFLLAENTSEKRVIYTGYRPIDEFKDKEGLRRSLLMECLKSLMIGGLEYSEAIYRMNQKEQEDAVNTES